MATDRYQAQVPIVCNGCPGGLPSFLCLECQANLCEKCSKTHDVKFTSHTVVSKSVNLPRAKEEEKNDSSNRALGDKLSFELISQFSLGFVVKNILPTGVSTAWISRHNDDVISVYDVDGKRDKIIHLQYPVFDFAFTSSKRLILAVFERNQIIIGYRSLEGEINVNTIGPRSVCCTPKDEILASQWDSRDGEGKIVRYSSKGEKLQEIIKGVEGEHLFQCPSKIALNGNGDICVVDTVCKHVVVVDKGGKHRFTYRRNKSELRQREFYPGDICTDVHHNILISDTFNDCLDIIDCDGKLRGTLRLNNLLPGPNGLSVDQKGNLWIGNWNGKVIIMKCLLENVEFTHL